ncbi:Pentatricopeptide repeat-containing protein [Dioscorea alata]|uniref:Pentatricopeptide repeat-containing protein n=1 Tax=Dioscorea alata TaxID=55571 RepID=A0ACB7WIW3_DIOAL|nr:Pentatricopeptide repeat-containing protein [Dioscorea alata]
MLALPPLSVVCDVLDHMKRKCCNSVPVDALIMILRTYTDKHLTHLRKFAMKKKLKLKTELVLDAFNLLLDSLPKSCLVEEAVLLFRRMKSKVVPDANTYSTLFFG